MVLAAFVIVPILTTIAMWLFYNNYRHGVFHVQFTVRPKSPHVVHHQFLGQNNLQLLVVLGLIGKFTSYMGLVRVCLPLDAVIHII